MGNVGREKKVEDFRRVRSVKVKTEEREKVLQVRQLDVEDRGSGG